MHTYKYDIQINNGGFFAFPQKTRGLRKQTRRVLTVFDLTELRCLVLLAI